jgi:hypothetical protein
MIALGSRAVISAVEVLRQVLEVVQQTPKMEGRFMDVRRSQRTANPRYLPSYASTFASPPSCTIPISRSARFRAGDTRGYCPSGLRPSGVHVLAKHIRQSPLRESFYGVQRRKDVPCGGCPRPPCQLRLVVRGRGSRSFLHGRRESYEIVGLAVQASLPCPDSNRVWR